jgi:hypothetical protein
VADPIGKKLSLREVEADPKVIVEYIHRELGPMVERLRILLSGMALRFPAGEGDPEGAVEAAPGSLYQRTDGAPGTLIYRKDSGVGDTGWTAVL